MSTPTVEEYARTGVSAGLLGGEVAEHGTALTPLLSAEAANAALNDGKSLLRLGTRIASACSRDKITRLWAVTDAGHRLLAAALMVDPDTLAAHRLGDRAGAVAIVDAVTVTALALDRAAAVLKRTGVDRVHAITIEVYSALPTPHLDSVVSIGRAPALRRAQ